MFSLGEKNVSVNRPEGKSRNYMQNMFLLNPVLKTPRDTSCFCHASSCKAAVLHWE